VSGPVERLGAGGALNISGVQDGFPNLKGDLLEFVPPVIEDLLLMI
jgi:hypothetical protein